MSRIIFLIYCLLIFSCDSNPKSRFPDLEKEFCEILCYLEQYDLLLRDDNTGMILLNNRIILNQLGDIKIVFEKEKILSCGKSNFYFVSFNNDIQDYNSIQQLSFYELKDEEELGLNIFYQDNLKSEKIIPGMEKGYFKKIILDFSNGIIKHRLSIESIEN